MAPIRIRPLGGGSAPRPRTEPETSKGRPSAEPRFKKSRRDVFPDVGICEVLLVGGSGKPERLVPSDPARAPEFIGGGVGPRLRERRRGRGPGNVGEEQH